jgi:hypothetical protein
MMTNKEITLLARGLQDKHELLSEEKVGKLSKYIDCF